MHIGLIAQGGVGWAGGSEYIRNLAHAIRIADKFARITLFLSEPQRPEWQAQAGLFDALTPVPAPPPAVKSAVQSHEPNARFAGVVKASGVEFLYPLTYDNNYNIGVKFPLGELGCEWAGWIPDFQHRFLPHFFGADEVQRREQEIRKLLSEARTLVFSSESAAADYRQFYPGGTARVEVLHFATFPQPDWYEPGTLSGIESVPERFLLVCNQFWKHKNHLTLFRSLEKLRTRGVRPTVLCTGALTDFRDPGFSNTILAAIQSAGLEKQVRLLGLIPRRVQIELLRRCIAVIQPSLFEGWSTVVEDTRVFGKPVLLSSLAVHREQNPPGARFFPPEDVEALADMIEVAWETLPHGVQGLAEQKARASTNDALAKVGTRLIQIAAGTRNHISAHN